MRKTSIIVPPVELQKIFNGRDKSHEPDDYNTGLYKTARDYVLACFDEEMAYHSSPVTAEIDMDLFEYVTVARFVTELKSTRRQILSANMYAKLKGKSARIGC